MRRPSRFPRTISNFRCCTACAPTYNGGSSRMATASASTSPTAATGFPISCGVSPSVLPTWASSSAISSAREPVSELLLPAHGDAVAQGDQDRVELFQSVHQPVEFLDTLRVSVVRRCRPRRFSRPQRVVSDEQAAAAQLGQCREQCGGILVFVYVVENQIKCARSFLYQFQGITNTDFDPFGHARPAKIILRTAGFLGIAIAIEHLGLGPRRPRQPDRRIPNGRAHLKNPPGARNLHKKRQHPPDRRPDDRNTVLLGVILHLPDDAIALRQQPVKIFFDVVLNITALQILAANHSFSPGFSA